MRKHELLEEEAAKRAKEAPKVTIDDKGFWMALPGQVVRAEDSRPDADRRALLLRHRRLQANNTFLIRRFRPSLDGTLFSLVDFRMVPEFAGTVTILDAYIDVHPWEWLRLRVGKMKGRSASNDCRATPTSRCSSARSIRT